MKKSLILSIGLCLIFTTLNAQTFKVIPKGFEKIEGYLSHTYPWSYKQVHFQQLWYGKAIAKNTAILNAIWYRRDGKSTSSYSSWSYKCDVTLYITSVTPRKMSKTWATNIGGAKGTTVFSGTINIPSANPPTKPTDIPCAWAFKVPFKSPYIFQVNKGNLLMELYQKDSYARNTWASDATRQSYTSGGHLGYIGIGCKGSNGEYIKATISSHNLMPSGNIDAKIYWSSSGVLGGVAWIGFSRTNFGKINLPFDLSGFGAIGCYLYCEIFDVISIANSNAHAIWPLPNFPWLAGYNIYLQAAGFSLTANPGGAIFSDGYYMSIGPGSTDPGVTQSVFRWKNNSATTGFMSPTFFYAPIVRFQGVFN